MQFSCLASSFHRNRATSAFVNFGEGQPEEAARAAPKHETVLVDTSVRLFDDSIFFNTDFSSRFLSRHHHFTVAPDLLPLTLLVPNTSSPLTSTLLSNLPSSQSFFIDHGYSISDHLVCKRHLYGTSIRSLNGGGRLLSLNSSFVSCLVDATNENMPFTTQTNLTADHSLFSFKLSTFKECSTTDSGGAIYCYKINVDVSIDSSDVEVRLNKEVSGTLLVVVSNVEGERVEVTDGIPNIGRVLEFSMPSWSSIGSCSVSIGETGLLQTPLSDYSIVAAFLPGHAMSSPTPQILKATCRLGNGTNHAWIQLTGLNIAPGTYTVTLVGMRGFSFDVTFSGATDEKGRALSEETPVRLFGEGSTLTFGTEYQIDAVIHQTTKEQLNFGA
ncbi:hypothetical protein BLNAU_14215 [Blattamonas nauphoetae]|uniref:Uncharacterized protein n=1 Tax=Blattamonas nauphoetae TaxID=2049346 RepID=A0ABQ9XEA0_9EUKA|nr:hypothetical protein BLNAU_14215 [Blattamonas nauphoetae]